jgi:hypothetical protein
MPALFAVYNLIDILKAEEYDRYQTNTKIPVIRAALWRTGFNTWKIDNLSIYYYLNSYRIWIVVSGT